MFGIQFKIHTLTPNGDEDDYTFVADYNNNDLLADLMQQCAIDAAARHPCPDNYTSEDWLNAILVFADT